MCVCVCIYVLLWLCVCFIMGVFLCVCANSKHFNTKINDKKFQEVEKALKCQPGAHCTLYAFLMDYIKVGFLSFILIFIVTLNYYFIF